jgi:hypothetical protein
VHRRPGEQVSGTLVFTILHREKANKVFGKRSSRDCSQSFTTARLSKSASVHRLRRTRARGIVIKNTPPPLIDDFYDDFNIDDIDISDLAPSPPSATSSTPSTTTIIERYNSLHLILTYVQSNLSAGLSMLAMLMLWNMLICYTSMSYMFNLVHIFAMIYVLDLIMLLIWKLHNSLTAPRQMILTAPWTLGRIGVRRRGLRRQLLERVAQRVLEQVPGCPVVP